MWVQEIDMFIPFCFKNNNFIKSCRDYTNDYSICPKYLIDMTLSGKFLGKRKKFFFDNCLLDQYPTSELENNLRELIAKKYNVVSENIIFGAGCNGIFQNLIKIFFRQKNGNLVIPFYSFSQPEYATSSFNAITKRVFCKNNYCLDFDAMLKTIDKQTKAVFIANPNNPTGVYEDTEDIINFAKSIKIPLIVSEASIEFSKKKSLLDCDCPDNLIIVRSFSKAYGFAGLRLGFAVLPQKYHSLYNQNTTRFEVSSLSMFLGLQNINNKEVDVNIEKVIKEREWLRESLKKIGIEMIRSNSNILMSRDVYSDDFYAQLLKEGIGVVLVPNKNNQMHFRIAVQNETTNKKFILKMKEVKL